MAIDTEEIRATRGINWITKCICIDCKHSLWTEELLTDIDMKSEATKKMEEIINQYKTQKQRLFAEQISKDETVNELNKISTSDSSYYQVKSTTCECMSTGKITYKENWGKRQILMLKTCELFEKRV